MIDPALILLARLRFGAWARRIRRGLSTGRGLAFFIIGCLVFAMWLGPVIVGTIVGRAHATPADAHTVRDVLPLILLGITLGMALFSGGKIISFSPAEVDFLFAGPFSRHQLVLWKIAISAFGALWVAAIFSLWQVRHASLWIAGFIGIWLAWLLAQSLAMLILLAHQALMARRSSPVLRVAMVAGLVLLAVGIVNILSPLPAALQGDSFSLAEFLSQARQSLPARIVLAPFDVLAMAFTAERAFPDLALWTLASLALLAILIALILRLDSYFIETSLRASEAVHAAVQRAKRTGNNPFSGGAKPVRWLGLPMLPWLGGAGPIAWRQCVLALRGIRGLALVIVLVALGLVPFLWVSRRHDALVPLLIVLTFWTVFLLPSMLRFDFRSDLVHIENLKLLPIRPIAIAAGQIIAPAIALTLLGWVLIAALVALAPQRMLQPGLIALPFAPPLTYMLIAMENAVFLMFPTAQTMQTPGDMALMGRSIVVFFVKGLAMLLAIGAVAGLGGGTLLLTGSWAAGLIVAWLALTGAAIAITPIVALLFARFDPAIDRPAE